VSSWNVLKLIIEQMAEKKKILVMRFSAMGDVAMTTPIVYSLAQQFPNVEVTVLSRNQFADFFNENINFIGVNFNDYKGVWGLFKLFKKLKKNKYNYIADLHGVLRSQILSLFFMICGTKVARIDKGRAEKKQLVCSKNKVSKQLITSFERYAKVFSKLGFDIKYQSFETIKTNKKEDKANNLKYIGFAPFAKHKGKIYPLEKTEEIVEYFSNVENVKIFLFGGGKSEVEILDSWEKKYQNVESLAGKLRLAEEINIIDTLDVMFSMDSANMHIASLVNTPVVSVWGATHPFTGFYGWRQNPKNAIQLELNCRPCSVFGDKECLRHDYACLNNIESKIIIEKIKEFL
jgi:ADP-heptose:LPS heptosyltransferase